METTSGVFRLRGLQMTRIETFTDAAFAFALTLLVISLEPPSDMAGMVRALTQVPAFLLSAAMLMLFWWGHHEWSRRYGLDDRRTFLLSCMLVFTVLVFVYPLRFMFTVMMGWIGSLVGAELAPGVTIGGPGDVNTIFVVYGVGFTAMSGALLLLNRHAWQQREALQLDAAERAETLTTVGIYCILTVTGVVSTLVAIPAIVPPGVPGWIYATLPITTNLYEKRRRRELPASRALGAT